MSEEVRAGWAVRRYLPNADVCPPGEHGVNTWGQFFACCPDPSRPNVTELNFRKCDLDSELGDLTPQPRCANSTWTLWTYESGFFCCDPTIRNRATTIYLLASWVVPPVLGSRRLIRMMCGMQGITHSLTVCAATFLEA
ncbi:hypothetical protein ASPSYDRAFT_92969 [Aspergillus sydowii CBS 593.65]|uniref:Uncharacterized protein n=1 Tax=Aspergillus sydowii CBS 593.65 TaxID=1036612 RepID=A0A1L9T6M1_9EURO|nr:uncharacterized protein ASPSYDRAFT_92969 [Aspergillus sydowii CBS 593.65]OJJ54933.1 hypothetical protein ASPSYDRAFT_92969 [Aspergillus sydowii CBS 593.65]